MAASSDMKSAAIAVICTLSDAYDKVHYTKHNKGCNSYSWICSLCYI